MDDLDLFIVENNVSMFFDRLVMEPSDGQRAVLSRLLLEEADKFGERAAHLDKLDSYVARCDIQIARHQALLSDGLHGEDDMRLIASTLANILKFKALLHAAHHRAGRHLDGP